MRNLRDFWCVAMQCCHMAHGGLRTCVFLSDVCHHGLLLPHAIKELFKNREYAIIIEHMFVQQCSL